MFCARCWSAVGPHDRACRECQLDLTRPGSVRLTDPRRVPRDIDGNPITTPAAGQQATPPAPAYDAPMAEPALGKPDAAPAPTPVKGPGWWSGVKSQLLAIGEKAAAANRARAAAAAQQPQPQPPALGQPQAPLGPPPISEAGLTTVLRPGFGDADRTVIREPAVPVDGERTVIREPVQPDEGESTVIREPVRPDAGERTVIRQPVQSDEGERTVIREPAQPADGERTVIRQVAGQDADRTVIRASQDDETVMRPRRDPRELSLWDDYGMANAPEGLGIDKDAGLRERIGHLLGATAVPAAKTLTFLAVLAATVVVLALLMGRLLTLDSLVVVNPGHTPTFPTPTSAASAAEPAPTSAPPASAEQTSATPSQASTPQTPSMAAGAKQCDPGVWAGPQTSCALANAVADQVRLDMTGTIVVQAFSSSSNQTYRLECTADRGITCNGLDGVQGVHVWLVTNS